MLTLEEFKQYYYLHKRFPDGQYANENKLLNEKQLKTKYGKYCRKTQKQEDEKSKFDIETNTWNNENISSYMDAIYKIEQKVREESPNAELFYSRILELDKKWNTDFCQYFKTKNKILGDIYDPAHIFSRSSNPKLSSEKLNIIILPRFVHSLLDSYLEIFDKKHKSITKERRNEIWKLLIGNERWNKLEELISSND